MGGSTRGRSRQPAPQPADDAQAKAAAEQAEADAQAKAAAEQAEADAQAKAAAEKAEAESRRWPVAKTGPRIVEIRASRPSFRRAGLAFRSADWTPVVLDDLTTAQILALLQEPVLSIRSRDADGEVTAMPADIRAGLIEVLADELADEETPAA